MISISLYENSLNAEWDNFVTIAKNSHFFFKRQYLEYHSDRFLDHSLMFYDDNKNLVGLLPANIDGKTLFTHQGLTFGGVLIDERASTEMVIALFKSMFGFARDSGIENIIYKCVPHIYHRIPSEEDRYALFLNNAELIRRDITSTINLKQPPRYSKGRRWGINKAKKLQLSVHRSNDFHSFWILLSKVLEAGHGAKPTHSFKEIEYLSERFPDNIKLYVTEKNSSILSGALIFENHNIVHTQYMANSEEGREFCALDYLVDFLIKDTFNQKQYFDFGISNECNGRHLNSGLIAQKEGFGARPVAHDVYKIAINKY